MRALGSGSVCVRVWVRRVGARLTLLSSLFLLFLPHVRSFSSRRLYGWWSNLGEMRWSVERQVDTLRHLIAPTSHANALKMADHAAAPSSAASPSADTSAATAPLTASPYSTPLLLSRLRDSLQPHKQRVVDAWQRQKDKLMSKL